MNLKFIPYTPAISVGIVMSAQHAALSAHVTLDAGDDWLRILDEARAMLATRFAIDHVTLQPSWPTPTSYGDRRVIPIAPRGEGERA